MRSIEIVYKGRDNTIQSRLKARGVAVDLSLITKMELVGSGWSVDSVSDTSGIFDFSTGNGVVTLTLGGIEAIPYEMSDFKLITYDQDNMAGIVWGSVNIYAK